MKITDVKSTIVAVPLTKVTTTSVFTFGDSPLVSVLVEVSTDAGIAGIGESPVLSGAEICKSMIDAAKPLLVGQDPFQIDKLRKKIYARFEDGHLPVPEKPGLGVELDHAKVEKYSRLYDHEVRGKEFSTPWQSPRKILGLKDDVQDWLPMSAQY